MRLKQSAFFLFLVLPILACGLNPVEQIKDAAAEKAAETITETIIEQASGAENVDISFDDDSASFTVTDEEGNEISMSSEIEADITAIEGMGFVIDVPNGLTNGQLQRMQENGEDSIISATFDAGETTAEQFFKQIHQELTAAGFVYLDAFDTGKTEPDPLAESFLPFVTYEHPDGFSFSIIWGEGTAILGLSKTQ